MNSHIVILPGDGVGPEVTEEAVRVLDHVAEKFHHQFTFERHLIGGCAIEDSGTALSDETLAACKSASAVLLGAVGGPKWDDPAASVRPEQGLLALRKGLEVFANLRPVKPHQALQNISPLRPEKLLGVDVLVVRELTGGLYFGLPKGRDRVNGHVRAVDTLEYHDYEIKRVLELAFKLAKQRKSKVTSVDKANVLETSRLWRQLANDMKENFPNVELEHMLVDTASMRLLSSPSAFDVLVTENMFGDILTDEASMIAGSMGMLPSASLGAGRVGLYEPIHGSAPDIAGRGIANPIGAILSAAMLLRYSLRREVEADRVESAVNAALDEGCLTADLGGRLTTREMANAIIDRI